MRTAARVAWNPRALVLVALLANLGFTWVCWEYPKSSSDSQKMPVEKRNDTLAEDVRALQQRATAVEQAIGCGLGDCPRIKAGASPKKLRALERQVNLLSVGGRVDFSDLEVIASEMGEVNTKLTKMAAAFDKHCHTGYVWIPVGDQTSQQTVDACEVWFED